MPDGLGAYCSGTPIRDRCDQSGEGWATVRVQSCVSADRNGGVDNEIVDTTIDGFNMKWFNGAGINVEMRGTGNIAPAGSTVPESNRAILRVAGNRIIARAPRTFCSQRRTPCATNADCPGADSCSQAAQIDAITLNVTSGYFDDVDLNDPNVDLSGKTWPKPTIGGNVIVTNGSPAIRCFGCTDTTVAGNCLAPILPGKSPDLAARACTSCLADPTTCHRVPSGTGAPFTGIAIIQVPQTNLVDPPLGNFTARDNRLFGGGGGHAVFIQSGHPRATGATVSGNAVANWHTEWTANSQAAIEVWGLSDVVVEDNRINGACTVRNLGAPCPTDAFVNNHLIPDVIEPACTASCP